MKKIMKKAVVFFMTVFMAGQCITAPAAETALVKVRAEEIKKGDSSVKVHCMLEGGVGVSSGKIRIRYNAEMLQLKSAKAGSVLEGAMCEINDCLNGNKEEGELVAAFASASPIPGDGSLLDLELTPEDSLKPGSAMEITAVVEELAGENGDVDVRVENLSATPTPGSSDQETGKTGIVKTGDETEVLESVVLAGITLIGSLLMLVYRKKKTDKA